MSRMLRKLLFPAVAVTLAACAGDAEPEADLEVAAGGIDSVAVAPAATPAPAMVDGQMLDPETATADQLATVPGIDATLADAIVAGRPFEDMTEVDAILAGTLSETQRDEVYRRLWKPIDLNTASDEEILLIPGIGDRMLHEFKEYRPYQAIAQFRREMGKYVDDAEVARMEQYVEVR